MEEGAVPHDAAERRAVLVSLLQAMLALDNNLRLEALKKLEYFTHNVPLTASMFMSIVLDKNVDETTRFMAIVQMKNLFRNQWTKKKSLISQEERTYLQKCMLSDLLDDESQKISLQVALIISEVSDWDYPEYWPDFFSQLLGVIQSTNSMRVRLRGFNILHETVKKLANKKDKSRITVLAPLFMKFVGSVWLKLSLVFLSTLASPELSGGIGGEGPREIALEHVINAEICNMCLRMLHHLLVRAGYLQVGSKEPVVAEVVGKMLEIWKNLVSFAVMHPNHILMTQIFKYINRMAKFSSEAQEDHPKAFMRYVRPYLEFACTQIIDFVPDKVPDKYIIHNMIFLRAVVDKRKDAATNSELYNATSSIFTRIFFSKLTAAMVANFFPTTISDMKLWEQKPEAFVSEERRCPWRHSRKACAEVLFGSSIRNYPATVCPVILEFFQGLVKEENSLQGREVPMEHIQKKDAVYYAVGLASEDIAAKLPFEKLLVTYLLPDLKNPDTRYRIIRHRIAFIIECWAKHIQSLRKPTLVQAVYEVLCTLMADEDLAVRLSATCAFRVMVDDQDFRLEDFSRFIEVSIELICRLVPTIAEVESNMQVIKIVHAIIMRLQDHLDAYVPKLLECLTSLWRATEEDDDNAMLLKSNILRTLNLVIKVLGPKAVNYYNFFLETITNSTDLPATRSLTMLEDGLTLWVSLLRFVPYNPVLADVFPTISGILEFSGEEEYNIRRQILRIIEAYIFMGGAEFLTKNLPGVITATAELVDCEDDYQHRAVMRIIEQLLIRFPKEVSYLLHPLYEKIFIFMLMDRDEKEEAQQKQSGGEKEKEDDRRSVDASASEGMADNNPIALSHDDTDLQYYLTLLRLLATDADTFLTFLTRFSQSHSSQPSSAGPTNPEIDLPTPVHYLYRFVEKLIAILGKTARTPEQDMTRYKRRQEIHFRRLVVIALSVLFASILPKFGFTENFGMSHEQLTELAGIQQRMICAVVNAASVMIKDIHELTVSDQGSQQPLVEIKLNLVEQARDALEQFDPVTSVDVVQLFVGKINELASTYTMLSKEQIMASIDGFVLQKLSGQ